MSLEHQHRIPDNAPSVSMELGIKNHLKPGEVIDVDYDALSDVLQRLDAPEDNSNLNVRIREPKDSKLGYIHGSFDADTGSDVELHYGKDANKHLQHELKHYSDHEKGEFSDRRSRIITRLGNLSTDSTMAMTGALVAGNAVSLVNNYAEMKYGSPFIDREVLKQGMEATSIMFLGSAALQGFYWFNSSERGARRAGRMKAEPIIRTVHSSES